jgi:serine/threonine protein kinase
MARSASPAVHKVGNYLILEKIGDGGMGTVYKGRNAATSEVVAIKLVSPQVVADEKLRMRFAQECQVARLLTHPNVVRMLDFGLEGSTPYLVMEYVDGASLGQRLETRGPIPEADAVRWVRQVGEALHWAHEKKLVHRDVKPDNILVSAAGEVKLADLGLAKSLEGTLDLTRTNTFFGTPNFMAPEQFVDAKRADAQSDLYSLAASLYMILTGKLPFEATGGVVRVYQKKMANDIEPPIRIVPGLSDKVNAAILRALRAERHERPASVLEFINLLTEESATTSTTAGVSQAASITSLPETMALANADEKDRRVTDPHGEKFVPSGALLAFAVLLLAGLLGVVVAVAGRLG